MRVRMKLICCLDDVFSFGFLGGLWNIVCFFGVFFVVLVEEDLFYYSGMNRFMFKFFYKKWLWKFDLCFFFVSRVGWCEWYWRVLRVCFLVMVRNGRFVLLNWIGFFSGMDCIVVVVFKWLVVVYMMVFWWCYCMRWFLICDLLCNNSFRMESRVRLLRYFCNLWDFFLFICFDMFV